MHINTPFTNSLERTIFIRDVMIDGYFDEFDDVTIYYFISTSCMLLYPLL